MERDDTVRELTEQEISEREIIQEYDSGIVVEERWGEATCSLYSLSFNHADSNSIPQITSPRQNYDYSYDLSDWVAVIDSRENELLVYSRKWWEMIMEEWTELLFRCGGNIRITEHPDIIPTKVAASGKPAIAVYLHAGFSLRNRTIGRYLGVEKRTASQYRTDFPQRRR